MISIPLVLIAAFILGICFDTSWMSTTNLIATMLMIYPTMIGIQWKSLIHLTDKKLISFAMIINFMIIPSIAHGLGYIFLQNQPVLFAGLALAALLPTRDRKSVV